MRPIRLWRPATLLAVLALGLLFVAPATARAVEHRTGDTVIVGANEVIEDDLVLTGTTVVINGVVKGDVVAAAQTVEVHGVIEGDLLAVASGVTISGTVRDDARILAGVIMLEPPAVLGDDLMAGGSSLELRPGSAIHGSLLFGGTQALLAGPVSERVAFAGEGLELRSQVGGDVEAYVGAASAPTWAAQARFEGAPTAPPVRGGLTVADTARVNGDLMYTGPDRVTLPAEAVAGRVTFDQRVAESAATAAQPAPWAGLFDLLRRYAALLLVGVLLIWLAPRFSRAVPAELEAQPLASLGWGFISILAIILLFVLVPVVTIFLAVVLGMVKLTGLMGLVIAAGVLALLALAILTIIAIAYVAQIAVSYELGRLALQRLRPAWLERPVVPLALGLLALVLLTALPMVGWLFGLAAVLLGLGALWLFGRDVAAHHPLPAAAT